MSILGGSKLGIPKASIHGHSQAPPWPLESMSTSAGPCLQGSHEESPLGLTLGHLRSPSDLARCLGETKVPLIHSIILIDDNTY